MLLVLFLLILFNYPCSLCVCVHVWHSVHLRVWKQPPRISLSSHLVCPQDPTPACHQSLYPLSSRQRRLPPSICITCSLYTMPGNASFIQDRSFSQFSVYKCCLYFCFSKYGLNKKPKLSVQVHTREALVPASCFQVSPAAVFLICSRSALTVWKPSKGFTVPRCWLSTLHCSCARHSWAWPLPSGCLHFLRYTAETIVNEAEPLLHFYSAIKGNTGTS